MSKQSKQKQETIPATEPAAAEERDPALSGNFYGVVKLSEGWCVMKHTLDRGMVVHSERMSEPVPYMQHAFVAIQRAAFKEYRDMTMGTPEVEGHSV